MAWRWVGLGLLGLLGLGCSGKTPDKGDAGTQGVSCTAKPSACTLPPAPGNEPPNKSGTRTVIAISKLYLGDSDRDGKVDRNAWKSYGYNLDGLISKPTDVNHCTPQDGANPPYEKTDGEGGIDNSFGENLVALLQLNDNGESTEANWAIAFGRATLLFRFDNLLDPDKAPNQTGISGAIYEGADKGSPAAFDGSDVWPVSAESVNGSVDAPSETFSGSYVSGGVWVSHVKPDVVLPIITQTYTLLLPIHRAVITMHIHGTGASATAVDGTIAGVVDPEAFDPFVWTLLPLTGFCSQDHHDGFLQQFRVACDIMSDGTNGDPTKTCDAISIGVGFEGTAASLGDVAPPAPPPPDSCSPQPDAGSGGAGTADAGQVDAAAE